jgi:hypothetical protein
MIFAKEYSVVTDRHLVHLQDQKHLGSNLAPSILSKKKDDVSCDQ